jgi:hypothetical protein
VGVRNLPGEQLINRETPPALQKPTQNKSRNGAIHLYSKTPENAVSSLTDDLGSQQFFVGQGLPSSSTQNHQNILTNRVVSNAAIKNAGPAKIEALSADSQYSYTDDQSFMILDENAEELRVLFIYARIMKILLIGFGMLLKVWLVRYLGQLHTHLPLLALKILETSRSPQKKIPPSIVTYFNHT